MSDQMFITGEGATASLALEQLSVKALDHGVTQSPPEEPVLAYYFVQNPLLRDSLAHAEFRPLSRRLHAVRGCIWNLW